MPTVADLIAQAKAATDDPQLQDNHLFCLLFNRENGLYCDKPGARRLSRRKWIERYFRVRDERGQIVPLILNHAQRQLEATVLRMERAGIPVRVQILKARKEGVSTYVGALAMERGLRSEYFRSLIVAHKQDSAKILLGMVNIARQKMPKSAKEAWDFKMKSQAKRSLEWEAPLYTEMTITSADADNPARGGTPSLCHLCLAPGTPVLVDDGKIVAIEDVREGARVVTHTGAVTTVRRVWGSAPTKENGGGAGVRIRPWHGRGIDLTPNHPVYTDRGWVEAGDLTLAHRVSMPVRPITHEIREGRLPAWATRQRWGGGRKPKAAGATIELTEEVGFAIGYYLAEGSLMRNKNGYSGVSFARHRSEAEYGQRALAALAPFTTSARTDQKRACLTDVDTVYGSPIARWIAAEFGDASDKRIPDWVFRAGREFVRGLLAGYLSGDCSKGATKSGKHMTYTVAVTSIRASLVTQARDIAASLGYGWGSITFKPGGDLFGRNCKDAWNALWSGQAARSLRRLVGLPVVEPRRAHHAEKSQCAEGCVWIRIRSIEDVRLDYVYDLEVEHADHSFRTLHFAVKNSESAFYPKSDETAAAILSSLPALPGTYAFDESTANGAGGKFYSDFWAAWKEREEQIGTRSNPWVALFFPWWTHDSYRYSRSYGAGRKVPEEIYKQIVNARDGEEDWLLRRKYIRRWRHDDEWEQVPVSETEELKLTRDGKIVGTWRNAEKGRVKWRRKGVGWQKVDVDQLVWRRMKMADKDFTGGEDPRAKFDQEYPSRPEVAFASTGAPMFDQVEISRRLDAMSASKPVFRGTLTSPGLVRTTALQAIESRDEFVPPQTPA